MFVSVDVCWAIGWCASVILISIQGPRRSTRRQRGKCILLLARARLSIITGDRRALNAIIALAVEQRVPLVCMPREQSIKIEYIFRDAALIWQEDIAIKSSQMDGRNVNQEFVGRPNIFLSLYESERARLGARRERQGNNENSYLNPFKNYMICQEELFHHW